MARSPARERIVVLVDMDCFYVQVEERDHPAIRGRPAAVVQYNTHRGGGIIAVNYEARACGVKRGMRGTDATAACPEITLVQVPTQRNKANLSKYRNAGKEVLDVMCQYSELVERASIDEAYLDVTQVVDDIIKKYKNGGETCNELSKSVVNDPDQKHAIGVPNVEIDGSSNVATNNRTLLCNDKNSGLISIIPTLEELPSTWVQLPLSNPVDNIYALHEDEQRRKYELETTAVSDWRPGEVQDPGNTIMKINEVPTSIPDREELNNMENEAKNKDPTAAEETDPPVGALDVLEMEKTPAEKEAERVQGLSSWLANLRLDLKTSSTFDDDGEDLNETVDEASTSCVNPAASDGLRLAVAARLCEEIRAAVLKETGFKCSAGIAHNKVLAKLVCGLHKPNQQTVLPQEGVAELWRDTAVYKVRNLGGKLGQTLQSELGCKTMADLSGLSLSTLLSRFDDKTAKWLHDLGQGRDNEAVVARQLPKSVGCSKNFLGRESLRTRARVAEWTRALAEELGERLVEDQELNKRVARTLTVSFRVGGGQDQNNSYGANSGTRSCPLPSYAPERIATVTMTILAPYNTAKSGDLWTPPLLNIGLSAGKFDDFLSSGMPSISDMFKKAAHRRSRSQDAGPSTGAENDVKYNIDMDSTAQCETENNRENIENKAEVSTKKNDEKPLHGIMNYFKDVKDAKESRASTSTATTKSTSAVNASGEKNSFFRNFIMRKEMSRSSGLSVKDSITSINSLGKSDDDSCEALSMLVQELEDSDDEEIKLSNDLKTKKILTSSTPAKKCDDLDSSAEYDASTDYDEDELIQYDGQNKNKADALLGADSLVDQDMTHLIAKRIEETSCVNYDVVSSKANEENLSLDLPTACSSLTTRNVVNVVTDGRVSVEELFPNLDEVDESILPHLPVDLRKAVQLALMKHKAERVGKPALNETGIRRFMKKVENCGNRTHNFIGESLASTENRTPLIENKATETRSATGIMRYLKDQTPRTTNVTYPSEASAGPSNQGSTNCTEINDFRPYIQTKSLFKANAITPTRLESLPTDNVKSNKPVKTVTTIDLDVNNKFEEECSTKCELCGERISFSDLAEHSDYHLAFDLQKQLGGTAAGEDRAFSSNTELTRQNKKRKISVPEHKKNKTIDSFFNK
ncbi:DNA polymerase eta isoform X2 [Hyalella azteca]|uniref:DNA polymerase eta n=1 Tax=Hyalella azteca TaxID=294128 RepID=A0A979FKC3_HYAAZ|nr:DNA polymerase eta isoform X2 [Hyalella azteca]